MRLHRGVPMLAAALTLATASPAFASEFVSDGNGSGQPTAASQHHSSDSAQWALDVGAAGGLAAIATGLAVTRSRARKRQHATVQVP
jgi:hypothetical protein